MHHRVDLELDLTGLESPLPMLKTKEVLDSLLPGQVVLVKTTSAGSEPNIRNLIAHLGVTLVAFDKRQGVFHFVIAKAAA